MKWFLRKGLLTEAIIFLITELQVTVNNTQCIKMFFLRQIYFAWNRKRPFVCT